MHMCMHMCMDMHMHMSDMQMCMHTRKILAQLSFVLDCLDLRFADALR